MIVQETCPRWLRICLLTGLFSCISRGGNCLLKECVLTELSSWTQSGLQISALPLNGGEREKAVNVLLPRNPPFPGTEIK